MVVVLTAPAGSSDEATAGCPAADAADGVVVVVVCAVDTDAGEAAAACVGVPTATALGVDVVVVVVVVAVVKGAGDEVSIGVGPFNCASDALSAAAAVFWVESFILLSSAAFSLAVVSALTELPTAVVVVLVGV